ncbi:helix-turn-helix domain-containing protein [Photobacterium sp. SDRW27]|uniref:helix-turn-helix transcriptional regulator n=1 Tax=Photobacterium obscurum TaxID=2829490 RepID=UPI00224382D7|nr:helix-turn-helix transcriptional regulator [Photobacterium obscurum]MCW8331475.1 helix-turn-helix domain-containing protein [Photobacterium obscurum]
METLKPQIAARIREAREWKDISQVAMAKCLDVARQTYLDLESGKTEPRVTTLMKIAEITGRPLTWFIYEETVSPPVEQNYDFSQLLALFSRVPEPTRTALLTHHIGLMRCYVEQSS